ncbi:hypothetical protein PRIPAC_96641 [Pristionchus pacificus]|uniref:Uncharacterized protein n=1 Tax=Pristionchus pacificus TaxID=54126 RepID=A0A2A6BCS4_PRIPA|nr:hypothetical protein PRIPAC_96641 [Pristionchus pacificus]|eukprot:PDM63677.1 hypothetical protein PRIPAC_49650 [Pristionchus pacificus]
MASISPPAPSWADQLANHPVNHWTYAERMFSWQTAFYLVGLYPCGRALAYAINSNVMPMRIRMLTFLVVSASQLLSVATFARSERIDAKELKEFQEGCTLAISYFFIWLLIHVSVNALLPSLHNVTANMSNIYTAFFAIHTIIVFRVYTNVTTYLEDDRLYLIVTGHVFMCGAIATVYRFHYNHRLADIYETEDEAIYDTVARRSSFFMLVYYGLFAVCASTFTAIAHTIGENTLFLETTLYSLVIFGAPYTLCVIIRPPFVDEDQTRTSEDVYEPLE